MHQSMHLNLHLPGSIEGGYDMADLPWPNDAKAGDLFYFYPNRFQATSSPHLAEAVYKITGVLFEENDGLTLILGLI